ncbi:MAG: efflux RND transporter periplasmic adaptor subunit, partial [Desulfobacterales bacterium]
VEYGRQFRVRTAASGFVRQVAVRDDQAVSAGELLLQLENNELAAQERDLALRLAQIDLQRRLAHSLGRLTELQILTEQRQTLAAEHQAAQLDLEQLAVTAPGSGRVIADHLASLPGRFLNRGSELLWVVSPDQIRLAASVAQEDIDAFRNAPDEVVEVDMRAAGLGRFQGRIARVAPAATTHLIHPALGAVYGGPLDVRQTALIAEGDLEQHYQIELFTPRFSVYLDLPEPILDQLRAGQTATVTARGSRLTLARLLGERIKAWLARKGAALPL